MMTKFIELHSVGNEPMLVNPSSVAFIEKAENEEGCLVKFAVSNMNGYFVIVHVRESYETLKSVLCL